MSSENSSDFKKLVKEVGIRKAIEIMKEKGIVYSGDFTNDHRTDSFFSTPYQTSNQKMNTLLDSDIEIAYAPARLSGNLYPSTTFSINKPIQKIPFSNSIFDITNLVIIPDGHLKSQETTSGLLITQSPDIPSVNQ